jgi:hypothetical protein
VWKSDQCMSLLPTSAVWKNRQARAAKLPHTHGHTNTHTPQHACREQRAASSQQPAAINPINPSMKSRCDDAKRRMHLVIGRRRVTARDHSLLPLSLNLSSQGCRVTEHGQDQYLCALRTSYKTIQRRQMVARFS